LAIVSRPQPPCPRRSCHKAVRQILRFFTTEVRAAGDEPLCAAASTKNHIPLGLAEGGGRRRNKLVIDGAERRFCSGANCLVLRGKVDDEGQLGLEDSVIQTRSSAVVFCILVLKFDLWSMD